MSPHSINGVHTKSKAPKVPETEVKPGKAKRRSFTAKQKLKILKEIEQLSHGELGAYLRRKGLYSSTVSGWRKQRDDGHLSPKGAPKRGRPPKSAETKRMEKLERENTKLRKQLVQADLIMAAQKKLCEIYSQETSNEGEQQ